MPVTFTKAHYWNTPADVLVNTVNCQGVMGKGIALSFKVKYPAMFEDYRESCLFGDVEPGKLHFWTCPATKVTIVNFPTKKRYQLRAEYDYIRRGLDALREYLYTKSEATRVNIPALGCSNGGLHWPFVAQMITNELQFAPCQIVVFEPQ